MKIAFFAKAPDATEFYRVIVPKKFLERAGHEVRVCYAEHHPSLPNSGVKLEDVDWADVVVFQRPVTPLVLGVIQTIKNQFPKKPILADYDDDYYSVPRWNPGYPHVKTNEESYQKMVTMFDGIITSTDPLRDVIRSKVKKDVEVCTIGNGFDFDMFDSLDPLPPMEIAAPEIRGNQLVHAYTVDTNQFNEMFKDRTVVCWAGSKFHYVDLDWLPEELKTVSEKNDEIIFLFVGYVQANIIKSVPINRLFTARGITPISNFYSFLRTVKIDIMLAPLDPCAFNQSKSNLKILEAMACHAYPICSAWDPYEMDLDPELHEDGMDSVHGKLAGYKQGDWVKEILETTEQLKDPVYKRKTQMENDAYIRATHNAEQRTDDYINFFQKMIDKKTIAG